MALNLGLLLGVGQPRLNDSIAAPRPRGRAAEAIYHEAGEHRQKGYRGERADAGAPKRADARVEIPHPHIDTRHSDEVSLRIIERCVRAHVAAHRLFHRLLIDGDLMPFERTAQRRVQGVVRHHDGIGRFSVALDVIQVVRAHDIVNSVLVEDGCVDVDDVGSGFVKFDERGQEGQVIRAAGLRLRLEQPVPVTIDQCRRNTGQLLELGSHRVQLCLPRGMPQVEQAQGGNHHDGASRQHPVQQRTVDTSK